MIPKLVKNESLWTLEFRASYHSPCPRGLRFRNLHTAHADCEKQNVDVAWELKFPSDPEEMAVENGK